MTENYCHMTMLLLTRSRYPVLAPSKLLVLLAVLIRLLLVTQVLPTVSSANLVWRDSSTWSMAWTGCAEHPTAIYGEIVQYSMACLAWLGRVAFYCTLLHEGWCLLGWEEELSSASLIEPSPTTYQPL